jgi:hypothetical protein
MYAEACAQTSDPNGLGLKCLQDIQKRAGSAHLSTELTMQEVKNEKSYEMWLEAVRFPDRYAGVIRMVLKIMVRTYQLPTMLFFTKNDRSIACMWRRQSQQGSNRFCER